MEKIDARLGNKLLQASYLRGFVLALSSVSEWVLMWHFAVVSNTFLTGEPEESTASSCCSLSPITCHNLTVTCAKKELTKNL